MWNFVKKNVNEEITSEGTWVLKFRVFFNYFLKMSDMQDVYSNITIDHDVLNYILMLTLWFDLISFV